MNKVDKDFEKLSLSDRVPPCEFARLQLDKVGSKRYFNLSEIKQKEAGYCAWCTKELPRARRRWCSEECLRSAMFHCCPQDPGPKMFRLIFDQNFACAGCGESYEEEIRAKIQEKYFRLNRTNMMSHREKVTLHYLGYGTGNKWQTDHVVPIHKGGKGIDPNNLQVLCVKCHIEKTKEDLR